MAPTGKAASTGVPINGAGTRGMPVGAEALGVGLATTARIEGQRPYGATLRRLRPLSMPLHRQLRGLAFFLISPEIPWGFLMSRDLCLVWPIAASRLPQWYRARADDNSGGSTTGSCTGTMPPPDKMGGASLDRPQIPSASARQPFRRRKCP